MLRPGKMATRKFPTPGYAGYNVAWSPFFPDRFAVASAANYGLVGNGRLHIFSTSSGPQKFFDTQDGIFDIAWSELHEHQIVSAGGDGSVKLWDVSLNDHPIRNWHEHSREVFSVDWNNIQKDLFATSSWDGSVKIVRFLIRNLIVSGTQNDPLLSRHFLLMRRVCTVAHGLRITQHCWPPRQEMEEHTFLTCV